MKKINNEEERKMNISAITLKIGDEIVCENGHTYTLGEGDRFYTFSIFNEFVDNLDSENRINHIPDILKKYIQKSGEKNYQLYKEAVDIIRMLKDDELDSFIEFAMDSGLKISDIDKFKQVLITIRKPTQS